MLLDIPGPVWSRAAINLIDIGCVTIVSGPWVCNVNVPMLNDDVSADNLGSVCP